MKLIIKEYLSSLKERDELDAILPDLLSEMGLTVFSTPGKGTRQHGVDVAAYGRLNNQVEKVYLFSIKAGNLTRSTWNGGSDQDLRPSLDEIIDAYIPSKLPIEYKNKPVVICLCFGGDIQEQVRLLVKGYTEKNSKNNITYEEWNGDKLAELILMNFLREDLLPKIYQSNLRKALSMIEQPEIAYKYFSKLINNLSKVKGIKNKEKIKRLRQLNISLWILFSWCREENNLESAYLASEKVLLNAWEIAKVFLGENKKINKDILTVYSNIQLLHIQISHEYLNKCVFPIADRKHGLSIAGYPRDSVDVNINLFEVLSRLAINGIWLFHIFKETSDNRLKKQLFMHSDTIISIINNNPISFTPYMENQTIDIMIIVYFLSCFEGRLKDINNWITGMFQMTKYNYESNCKYISILTDYKNLLEHPVDNSDEYKEEVTGGSVFYPTLALFASLLNNEELYNEIQEFKEENLKHCNFQFWLPDKNTEEHFYLNSSTHGYSLSDVPIEKEKEIFLRTLNEECNRNTHLSEMTAYKTDLFPLIFLGCKHYKLPIPIQLILDSNLNK